MELKDFIKTTMQSIIDATSDLIVDNVGKSVSINPLQNTSSDSSNVRYHDGVLPITLVSFDVAITEGASKSGGGGARVDVVFAKVGADGQISSSNENVSRVQFSLRAALPATAKPPSGMKLNGDMVKIAQE